MKKEDFKNYINEICYIIKENAKRAKFDADISKQSDVDYNTGFLSLLTLQNGKKL